MPSWHWAAFFLNIKDLRYISQKIRDCNPGLFQIVGGQIATVMADLILEATGVDCVGLLRRGKNHSRVGSDSAGKRGLEKNK